MPKTIDNDVAFIDKSFGFDTAVAEAVHTAIYAFSCYCNICPHATGYVSSCYWVCVLMLLIYVSSCYYYRCVVYYYMQRPHTATSRPSYYLVCVLMLLQYVSSTTIRSTRRSSLILLHLGPHTAADVSSCYYYVSSTTICSALILLHLGPHTAADAIEARDPINVYVCVLLLLYVSSYYIYVSSFCYISVRILLHMRPHTGQSPYVRAD